MLMLCECVLCVVDNEQDVLIQLVVVLVVGCEVLWLDSVLQCDLVKKLLWEVSECICFVKVEQLSGQVFDVVIYYGDFDQLCELCEQVVVCDGVIVFVQGFVCGEINLLLEWLYIECLLSVNIVVVGGNVSLMIIG